jgi:hypothetical protein
MKAWLFQDHRQKQKLGDAAPWSVGWIDPDGKRCGKSIGAKSRAEKFLRKTEGELAAGTYKNKSRKTWQDFRAEYDKKIMPRHALKTIEVTKSALDHFARLAKPAKMASIKTETIDSYVALRSMEKGKKAKSIVSPATVNRELRTIRSVLRIAVEWGYLTAVPRIRKVKEDQRIGAIITAEHFKSIYDACPTAATMPIGLPVSPGEWWQA